MATWQYCIRNENENYLLEEARIRGIDCERWEDGSYRQDPGTATYDLVHADVSVLEKFAAHLFDRFGPSVLF